MSLCSLNTRCLSGNGIKLRLLEESLFDEYLAQFSPEVRKALHVDNPQAELSYIKQAVIDQAEKKTYFFCIYDASTDKLIGALEIRARDAFRGQLYTWINHHYWGNGIFGQALALAAEYYFKETGERYFDATVDVANLQSYKALKKAGFADLALQEGAWGKQFVLIFRNVSR